MAIDERWARHAEALLLLNKELALVDDVGADGETS
jgi:hypothetical protein